jgi:hypothetical protein
MNDYKGDPVNVGDVVLEERGEVWKVTSDEYACTGIGKGCELRPRRGKWVEVRGNLIVRQDLCFKVELGSLPLDKKERARLWLALFNEHCAERVKAATRARHALADRTLRAAGIRNY